MVGQPVVILTSLPLSKALTSVCHQSTKTQMNTMKKRGDQEKDLCKDFELRGKLKIAISSFENCSFLLYLWNMFKTINNGLNLSIDDKI